MSVALLWDARQKVALDAMQGVWDPNKHSLEAFGVFRCGENNLGPGGLTTGPIQESLE
jgi:hypothetical protein